MPTETLYEKLPADAAAAVRAALANPGDPAPVFERHEYRNMKVTLAPGNHSEQREHLDKAFGAVDFPNGDQPVPLAETLTPAQRALAELVADQVVAIGGFAIPKAAWVRRRWLGLDPPSALEQSVTFELDGAMRSAPLWYALAQLGAADAAAEERSDDDAGDDDDNAGAGARARLFGSLPVAARLEAFGDIALGAYGLELDGLAPALDQLRDEGRQWAPRYADRLLELFDGDALHLERGEQTGVPDLVKAPLWLALARSGVTLEPRWDALFPVDVSENGVAITRELLAALPKERRAPACLHAFDDMFPNQAVRAALALIEDVPAVELAQAVIDRVDDVDGIPKRKLLERLAKVGEQHPAIAVLVAPLVAALPPPLGLRLGAVLAPANVSELSEVQIAQCARGNEMIQGCSDNWVGDEDIAYLQLGEILDDKGQRAYDFAVYMDEDGVFFRAGTDDPVAVLCQFSLDCPDPALKEGLQIALAEKPRR